MTSPTLRPRFVYVTATVGLAALCASGALLGQLGCFSLTLDILSQFAPVWLAGGTLAGLAALAIGSQPTRQAALALAATGAVAAGALMAPEFLRPTGPRAGPDAAGQIKVIQLNAWAQNPDPAGTVDWLVAQRPELIALEEVSPALRRAFNGRPGWHVACAGCPIEILSRDPPVETAILRHGAGRQVMTLVRATFRDRQGLYWLIAVHWPRATRPGFQQRQEWWLAQALPARGRTRTILVGDFNSTPWASSLRRWDAGLGLVRRDRALFSWPARLWGAPFPPLLPIDHAYAGAQWATVALARGPTLGSDHYPLILTLAPVGPGRAPARRSGPNGSVAKVEAAGDGVRRGPMSQPWRENSAR